MPVDQPAGKPELPPQRAHLVLEEPAQRLDQLEAHALGEPAHVVVRLDDLRAPARRGALDHVRVERPLRQELDRTELCRLLLEHRDELGADDAALGLGVGDSGQPVEEAPARIDHHHLEPAPAQLERHLGRFALAQQPVVDQDAVESLPDRAMTQSRHHRAVHSSR